MASLECLCGSILSNGQTPSDTVGSLVTGNDLEGFYGAEEVDECLSLLRQSRDVWECHQCGRLAVAVPEQKDPCAVKWYHPENGKPGALMAFEVNLSDNAAAGR